MHKKEDKSSDSGMIVIEASISLTIFILVVAMLIYLMNIFTLQNKVQFSINAAAHKAAMYSYLYQATSLRKAEQVVNKDFDEHTQKDVNTLNQIDDSVKKTQELVPQLQDTLSDIQSALGDAGQTTNDLKNFDFSTGVGTMQSDINALKTDYEKITGDVNKLKNDADGAYASYKKSFNMAKERFSNMDSTLAGLAYFAFDTGSNFLKNLIGAGLAKGLTESCFDADDYDSADQYLKAHGVADGMDGLDFSGSTVFWDADYSLIDFVVEYDVDLGFAKLILLKPTIHMVQRVVLPAWLNGDGGEVEMENGNLKVTLPKYK